MEGERIAVERRIRDEVYGEMQRHISETDEAMKQARAREGWESAGRRLGTHVRTHIWDRRHERDDA
eukprot:6196239-Pleurochrysis_carterae.AAC.6